MRHLHDMHLRRPWRQTPDALPCAWPRRARTSSSFPFTSGNGRYVAVCTSSTTVNSNSTARGRLFRRFGSRSWLFSFSFHLCLIDRDLLNSLMSVFTRSSIQILVSCGTSSDTTILTSVCSRELSTWTHAPLVFATFSLFQLSPLSVDFSLSLVLLTRARLSFSASFGAADRPPS